MTPQHAIKLARLFGRRLELVLIGFAQALIAHRIHLPAALRLNVALDSFAADVACRAGEIRAGPQRGQAVEFRELLAERERGEALS